MLRARRSRLIRLAGSALAGLTLVAAPVTFGAAQSGAAHAGVLDYDCGGDPGHRTGFLQPWGGCFQRTRESSAAWLWHEMEQTPGCYVPIPDVSDGDLGCFKADVQGGGSGYDPVGEVLRVKDQTLDGWIVGVYWRTYNLAPGQPPQKGICADSHEAQRVITSACDLPNIWEGSYLEMKMGRCHEATLSQCGRIKNWGGWGPTRTFYDDENSHGV